MKNRKIITIDVIGCKNWTEAQKIIEVVSLGCVKINVKPLKK